MGFFDSYMGANTGLFRPRVVSMTRTNSLPGAGGMAGGVGGAGTMGLGGAGAGAGGVSDYLQSEMSKAKQANQARFDKMIQLTENMGKSALLNNQQLTGQNQAAAQQGLVSRGLGNSTILNSVQQGIARQGQQAGDRINEQVAMDKSGMYERVSNPYPDLGLYASLLMRPGAMNGGLSGMFGTAGAARRAA